MPRQRLAWFKLWVGATRHEKVVTLDDRTFRAWIELLDAASEQPVRGRFTSCAAAAAIIRRPPALVRRIAEARLIDEREDGVWLHDWPDWQRWQPDDAPPEPPPNGTGKTHESLRNGTATTHELHANHEPPRVERAKTKTEKKSKDEEGDEDPPTADAVGPPTAAAAFSDQEREVIEEIQTTLGPFGLALRPEFWRKVLDEYGTLPLGMEAHKQADWLRHNHKRILSATRYTNWLDRAQARAPGTIAADEGATSPYAGRVCESCGEARSSWRGTMCSECYESVYPVPTAKGA